MPTCSAEEANIVSLVQPEVSCASNPLGLTMTVGAPCGRCVRISRSSTPSFSGGSTSTNITHRGRLSAPGPRPGRRHVALIASPSAVGSCSGSVQASTSVAQSRSASRKCSPRRRMNRGADRVVSTTAAATLASAFDRFGRSVGLHGHLLGFNPEPRLYRRASSVDGGRPGCLLESTLWSPIQASA